MNRSQDSCTCLTYPIHVCDMHAIYMGDIRMCDMHAIQRLDLLLPNCLARVVRPDSFARVTWLIYMCAMTRLYVCHDPFVKWFVHMCAMTRSYVCHDSFIHMPWRIYMTYLYTQHLDTLPSKLLARVVRPDSFACVLWLIHMCYGTYICVPWFIHILTSWHLFPWAPHPYFWACLICMCDVTHS